MKSSVLKRNADRRSAVSQAAGLQGMIDVATFERGDARRPAACDTAGWQPALQIWRGVVLLLVLAFGLPSTALAASTDTKSSDRFSLLASAPLYFEANRGQVDGAAPFIARGTDCSVWLAPTEATIVIAGRTEHSPSLAPKSGFATDAAPAAVRVVRLSLQNARSDATMTGVEALRARANYFIGNDPRDWRAGVPLFAGVRVDEVYPGIGLVYHADAASRLEYDFIVGPGAAPEQISFRVDGADRVRIDAAGNLVLQVEGGEIREHRPVIYQETGGARREIPGGYRLRRDGTIGFWLGEYDRRRSLIIDPTFVFSTYLGGSKLDIGWSIALDPAGNIYVAGETISSKLATTNAFQNKFRGGSTLFGDAFVAKYDNSGSNLLYLTYLGGRHDDGALGVAVDDSGFAYVTGFTDSHNFPITNAALRTVITGRSNNAVHVPPIDAFVAKLDPSGSSLVFSTLIGGDGRDEGFGIAVDATGIYVAGMTESTNNFAPAPNGFQTNSAGGADVFVVKLIDGTNFIYSTFLGGTNADFGEGLAVDSGGRAWITGFTLSTNFPLVNPIALNGVTYTNLNTRTNISPATDAFISELSADGASLLFSSYLGGTNNDVGMRIAMGPGGSAYVAGYTSSKDFPTNVVTSPTSGATNFSVHVFVTKVDSGGALLSSTQFGGSSRDQAIALAVDSTGNAYVGGVTSSTNFSEVPTFVVKTNNSGPVKTNTVWVPSPAFTDLLPTNLVARSRTPDNAFLVVLSPDLASFVSTNSIVFGGPGNDQVNSVVVDPSGSVAYITGQTTSSTNFPLVNPLQPLLGGAKKNKLQDAFVGKVQFP